MTEPAWLAPFTRGKDNRVGVLKKFSRWLYMRTHRDELSVIYKYLRTDIETLTRDDMAENLGVIKALVQLDLLEDAKHDSPK